MTKFHLTAKTPAETESLAQVLSLWARTGALIALSGDLGSGKSTFARAFIRTLMKQGFETDVPSPSFSLIQAYDETRLPVFHADLYRLKSMAEIADLGMEDLLQSHCGLVEWADRLERPLSENTLHVALAGSGESREITLIPTGSWPAALARNSTIAAFVKSPDMAIGSRVFFEGDASARRYETVSHEDKRVILMDMPQRPDGPIVRHGKPYSQIAHLAENITAVVAINRHLISNGYSAPRILSADLKQGLALIEPLGDKVFGQMLLAGEAMQVPMETAALLLADMVGKSWPSTVEAAPGHFHTVRPYDEEAQLIEVDLMPSWYIPFARGLAPTSDLNEDFEAVWQKILPLSLTDKPQWVMRDYHSPNLLWLPEREGLQRVGLIDTQDTVMGHPAYDLVSMIQDARVDIDPALADHVYRLYVATRRQQGQFSETDFATAYAVLGAQRATKILGIFARLNKRDGKPGYLKHMPRVSRYLTQNLEHPALAELKSWYIKYLPEALSA